MIEKRIRVAVSAGMFSSEREITIRVHMLPWKGPSPRPESHNPKVCRALVDETVLHGNFLLVSLVAQDNGVALIDIHRETYSHANAGSSRIYVSLSQLSDVHPPHLEQGTTVVPDNLFSLNTGRIIEQTLPKSNILSPKDFE